MPVQSCMFVDDATASALEALNPTSFAAGGMGLKPSERKVDNPVANSIVGLGEITGHVLGLNYVFARAMVDPQYATFLPLLEGRPIYTLDSDLLFLPQTEV